MNGIEGLINDFGIWAIVFVICLEYLGLPLPTELAYVAAGGLISAKILPYPVVFAALMVAHVVGATFSYSVGRKAARFAKETEFSHVQQRLMRWYRKYGAITILATQLLGHVRPWASYIAGFAQIKRSIFYTYNLIGSAVLTALMLLLADTLVALWNDNPWLQWVLTAVFIGVLLVTMVSMVRSWLHWRERRAQRALGGLTRQKPNQPQYSQTAKAKGRPKRAA
jgi:membrane protein DedA with SNARE-associated domain